MTAPDLSGAASAHSDEETRTTDGVWSEEVRRIAAAAIGSPHWASTLLDHPAVLAHVAELVAQVRAEALRDAEVLLRREHAHADVNLGAFRMGMNHAADMVAARVNLTLSNDDDVTWPAGASVLIRRATS